MMMNFISPEKCDEISGFGYDLNIIYILEMVSNNIDYTFKSSKFNSLIQTCQRKGLINELSITPKGKELLEIVYSTDFNLKLVKKRSKKKEDEFTLWWKTYPSSDTFEYKGKMFKGTRALRVKKEDCRVKINKILESKEYTIEELVEALKLEIEQKAENSIKTGINKMSFFQNSLTYLNQGTYDPYVELVRKGHRAEDEKTAKKTTYGGVSI